MSRPSLYRRKFCQEVIEIGRTGASRTQIARSLGVARNTLYQFTRAHPEFAYALSRATEAAQAWWENVGLAAIDLPANQFNTTLWCKVMNARFPKDWRETKLKEITDASGQPLQVPTTHAVIERAVKDAIKRIEQQVNEH
jgi:hypothetical protein